MTRYIRNLIFMCADEHELADFYCGLLDLRVLRTDWLVIGKDPEVSPRLAFDPAEDYRPPQWGNPDRPPQLHLDIPVSDLSGAEELALSLGATLLREFETHRVYADPAGHPFCLYVSQMENDQPRKPLSGRIGQIVLDCPDPSSLAAFYRDLALMPRSVVDEPEWVIIGRQDGSLPRLGFQRATFTPARWPDPEYPQQMHVDFHVNDKTKAMEDALRLGATRLPEMGGSCPVFADPAGHPFCLCGTDD